VRSFVCDGQYARGLERVLDSILTNVSQAQQPVVWVSGFYGSGKSHLVRVLEHLWRDVEPPCGDRARDLVTLPDNVGDHLTELSTAGKRLDELERVHADARGTGPGRRWGTEQLNRSLFVVLVAQFQIYCRDLHDEAIDVHVAAANARQADVLRTLLTQGRKIDVQNPPPAALGSDFGRLGFQLIPTLKAQGTEIEDALESLDLLVKFRNAVAHDNESVLQGLLSGGDIKATLTSYRAYRKTLNKLVDTMDQVVAEELASGLQIPPPW
jgi:hypothetical protein